jgi:H+/gluconate symporter-like permease
MPIAIILLALTLLMTAAYRGASVILFAPVAALLAVALTDPALILPLYSGVFLERMAGFIKLYFPVFLLGAVFGKVMEFSGFARAIIDGMLRFTGPRHAIPAVVLVCALLTYGGVSLFVVAFAVYPFAAELFRKSDIPKRLLPATIALGAFTFTMDALPGSPQIQNIIPTGFFHTTSWAAPSLGIAGSLFLLVGGLTYLEWRRRAAHRRGEGYGTGHVNEPDHPEHDRRVRPLVAALPLLLVGILNWHFSNWLPSRYGERFDFAGAGLAGIPVLDTSRLVAIWAVECALVVAIAFVLFWCFGPKRQALFPALNVAVGGALLATLNTGSEYGFGAVIAALPGFTSISQALAQSLRHPLLGMAVSTNVLAGITGSASGGMSIALASMSETWLRQAAQAGIPAEVLHRVAAMASGGMDTLPHNGAIITLLAITGLRHRSSYGDIFVLTALKTASAFFVILLYSSLGIV